MLTTHHLKLPHRSVVINLDDQNGTDHIAGIANRDGIDAYEAPLVTWFALAASLSVGDVLDIGANTGIYALVAAAANPHIEVHAFEPLPGIAACLRTNVNANPELCQQIDIVETALSNRSGTAEFFETINDAGLLSTSSGLDHQHAAAHGEYRTLEVPVDTLDAWAARAGSGAIGLMKIDVEGHERAVFEGAALLLQEYRPLIAVELLGGADFAFFADFLAASRYLDLSLNSRFARRLLKPVFMADAWNHIFCPVEHVWPFAQMCDALGLTLV